MSDAESHAVRLLERIEELEAENKRLRELKDELYIESRRLQAVITKIRDEAESSAFASDHIACYSCADTYWTARVALEESKNG